MGGFLCEYAFICEALSMNESARVFVCERRSRGEAVAEEGQKVTKGREQKQQHERQGNV